MVHSDAVGTLALNFTNCLVIDASSPVGVRIVRKQGKVLIDPADSFGLRLELVAS